MDENRWWPVPWQKTVPHWCQEPGDGWLCYPLTVADMHSRYLLGVQGLDSVAEEHAWPVFKRLFGEYGLPQVIRSDNGPPFASTSVAGLSHLSVQWIKLGIRLERITPGHPEQNGKHERMHRTLKAETARPPRCSSGSPAREVRSIPAHLQRGAAPRGHRAEDTYRAVRELATAVAGAAPGA
jgi:transposase InsO family protein